MKKYITFKDQLNKNYVDDSEHDYNNDLFYDEDLLCNEENEDYYVQSLDDQFPEYENNTNFKGKNGHMKTFKTESKPKWRYDRKIEKKFKHDVLGMD